MKLIVRISIMALVVVLFTGLAACGTTSSGGSVDAAGDTDRDYYSGTGRDTSLLRAMNKAKMDAVRKAVNDILGADRAAMWESSLEENLYSTNNPNKYVFKGTMEGDKDKFGNEFVYTITRIKVNRDAITATLTALDLMDSGAAGSDTSMAGADGSSGSSEVPSLEEERDYSGVSDDDLRFIQRYVSRMTYMVYFDEESVTDVTYAKAAVAIANRFLASKGIEVIDMEQVEELKKDQMRLFESETMGSVSMAQWLAMKLNADVYIEIDGSVEGQITGNMYMGSARVLLKAYEASTGRLLGSWTYKTDPTNPAVSTVSVADAIDNAIQSQVYKSMPYIIDQTKNFMEKALLDGIKYELVLINTYDQRLLSDFRRKIKRKVQSIETVSSTPEETKYEVYVMGSLDDLIDAVYDSSDTIPGLGGMTLVVSRGKSVTFNTGM